MKKSFSLTFHDCEIVLSKDKVHFQHGLGAVFPCYNLFKNKVYYNQQLFGLVDQSYREVVPLMLYDELKKISILDHHVLMLLDQEFIHVEQYDIDDDNIFSYYLNFCDYENMNNDVIKVWDAKTKMVSLYDINKKELLIPYFHRLDDFYYDPDREELVAMAYYFLFYDEERFDVILTSVNLKGEIIAPYYDFEHQLFFDQSMSLNEVSAIVSQDTKGQSR